MKNLHACKCTKFSDLFVKEKAVLFFCPKNNIFFINSIKTAKLSGFLTIKSAVYHHEMNFAVKYDKSENYICIIQKIDQQRFSNRFDDNWKDGENKTDFSTKSQIANCIKYLNYLDDRLK